MRMEDIYHSFDLDALSRWAPKPQTVTVPEELKSRAIPPGGLVANIDLEAINAALKRFGLRRYLPVIVTRNDMIMLKSEKNGVERAIDHLGAFKEECLFSGDSVTDVLASKNAKIDVTFVLGGESEEESIRQHEPNFIVEVLSQILGLT
jgi:pyrophosphatase PpaX